MGQSSGVLFKEVSAFQRCPLIEVSLYCVLIHSIPANQLACYLV